MEEKKTKKIMAFKPEFLTDKSLFIHCKTYEEGRAVYLWAVSQGKHWNFCPWDIYKENTCIKVAVSDYTDIDWIVDTKTIIDYDDAKIGLKEIVKIEIEEKIEEEVKEEDLETKVIEAVKVIHEETTEFFLEDHLPVKQREWLNLRRGILEDIMKRKEKQKRGKKEKPKPTAEAKIAKKEYNKVIELIKIIASEGVIPEEENEYMKGIYLDFKGSIMPSRNIPNKSYAPEELKGDDEMVRKVKKKKTKKKKKIREEFESGDVLDLNVPTVDIWGKKL